MLSTALKQRPAKIALIAFTGFDDAASRQADDWHGLRQYADWLNAQQSLFDFEAHSFKVSLPANSEGLHTYTHTQFYDCLKAQLKDVEEFDCAVGLSHIPQEHSEFNHHSDEDGVGVITIEGYQQYIPPNGSLKRYLAYLTMCEAFCLVGRKEFEHPDHRRCLFDICKDKAELTDCLREPQICSQCKTELDERGFKSAEVGDVEHFLHTLAKPPLGSALSAALRRPFANLLAGAVLAVAASTYAATTAGIDAWIPTLSLAGAFLLFVLYEYRLGGRKARHFKKTGNSKGGSFATLRASFAARRR